MHEPDQFGGLRRHDKGTDDDPGFTPGDNSTLLVTKLKRSPGVVIPTGTHSVIFDPIHFKANSSMLRAVNPLNNAIAHMHKEKRNAQRTHWQVLQGMLSDKWDTQINLTTKQGTPQRRWCLPRDRQMVWTTHIC